MLLSTRIKDFQSLHEVEIVHGGLTVLTGASDLGKSAVLRAIRLLHRNDSTAAYVRHGKVRLQVAQQFSNTVSPQGPPIVAEIEKSKTTNRYTVNDFVLAKVGREVPEIVREFLKTDPLILDKDLTCDLNFTGQFDSPFLLTESSTFVTKSVSVLSGIEIIYSAIREGASQAQKLKATSQVLAGTVENLSKFEKLQEKADILQSEIEGLRVQEDNLRTASNLIEKLASLLRRGDVLRSKIVNVVDEEITLKAFVEEYRTLLALKKSLEILNSLQSRKSKLKDPKTIDITALTGFLSKINIIFSVIKSEEKAYTTLVEKAQAALFRGIRRAEIIGQLTVLFVESEELTSKIKVCETCGRPL